MILGVANFDVAKEMIANSLRNNKIPLDSSLEMILLQRSFYPLLNSTVNNDESDRMDKTINVDYRKLKHLHMSAIPDVIFTPSAVNPYAKRIGSTLFINPGILFKSNNSVGSFAKIAVFPPTVNKKFNFLGLYRNRCVR